eukprot:Awhi_evm1s14482
MTRLPSGLAPPIPEMLRLCISGFTVSHYTKHGKELVEEIVKSNPEKYESWFFFCFTAKEHGAFVNQIKLKLPSDQKEKFNVRDGWSAPFIWIEKEDGSISAIGGCDETREWAAPLFPDNELIQKLCSTKPSLWDLFTINRA